MSNFNLVCPTPLKRYPHIVLGHGSGGQIMQDLISHLISPTLLTVNTGEPLTDSAIIDYTQYPPSDYQLAMTTDSFVVQPIFFPGGDIGSLAVHGTVNDLAMSGAKPLYLTVSFILEEGLPLETLSKICISIATAAKSASVQIITGDTKVVEKGHGDQIFINTTGIGMVNRKYHLSPLNIQPGDVLIINGSLGDHGMTIMGLRHKLDLGKHLQSDSAPLADLVATMLKASSNIHCLRDITRGGLAAVGNELAGDSHTQFEITEKAVPISKEVNSACEVLGIDPLTVANEGKLLAVVPKTDANKVLTAMKTHPLGKNSVIIGAVVPATSSKGLVIGVTEIGSKRVISLPLGELLPRIC